MKTTDIIRRAGRNLRRAKMRTLLTSIAIAVGGFAIMASLMAGEGARQYIDRLISSNIDAKAVFVVKDKRLIGAQSGQQADLREYNPDSINRYGNDYKALTQKDIDRLAARTDLEKVRPVYQLQPKYVSFAAKKDKKYSSDVSVFDGALAAEVVAGKQLGKGTELAVGEAVIPESYAEALGQSATQMVGKQLTVTVVQMPQKIDEAMLGQVFAEKGQAGVNELINGKELHKTFTIAAVTRKSADQTQAMRGIGINAKVARELSDYSTKGTSQYQKYMSATAVAKQDAEAAKKSLEHDGYAAATAKDLQQTLFRFVDILQGVVLGFGALALIVSIFGIVNTQYISVLERTQQIGLMKALGASRRDIGRLFRYEAAWVGLLGGALGVLGAWGAGVALNPVISEKLGFGDHKLLVFVPEHAAAVVAGLMLVAIIAGWLPSRKAAKLDPIEALRTE